MERDIIGSGRNEISHLINLHQLSNVAQTTTINQHHSSERQTGGCYKKDFEQTTIGQLTFALGRGIIYLLLLAQQTKRQRLYESSCYSYTFIQFHIHYPSHGVCQRLNLKRRLHLGLAKAPVQVEIHHHGGLEHVEGIVAELVPQHVAAGSLERLKASSWLDVSSNVWARRRGQEVRRKSCRKVRRTCRRSAAVKLVKVSLCTPAAILVGLFL